MTKCTSCELDAAWIPHLFLDSFSFQLTAEPQCSQHKDKWRVWNFLVDTPDLWAQLVERYEEDYGYRPSRAGVEVKWEGIN